MSTAVMNSTIKFKPQNCVSINAKDILSCEDRKNMSVNKN